MNKALATSGKDVSYVPRNAQTLNRSWRDRLTGGWEDSQGRGEVAGATSLPG